MGLRHAVAVLVALGLAVACASRSTTSAPPAAVPAAQHPGQFVWQDLVTEDVAACQRFYAGLLGWTFEETTRRGKPYLIASSDGARVAGLVGVKREDPAKPVSQWLSYVSVADVDQSVRQARSAGGRVLVEPVDIDGVARAAVIVDPQGALLGIARLAGADPIEPPQPILGRFFWREYLARDPDRALSFYAGLLGYQSEVTGEQDGFSYHVLRREHARAGLYRIPAGKGIEPNWLPYVKVGDPAALAARVAGLGGQVLLEPRADIREATLAVVADPSGAALALQKWPL